MTRNILAIVLLVITLIHPVKANTEASKVQSLLTDDQVHTLCDSIRQANRFVERLDSTTFFNLPVGFTGGPSGNPDYALLITKAKVTPQGATFTAYMSVKNPMDGTKLAFEAQNIQFSFKGGLSGDIRLALMSEAKIPVCKDVSLWFLPGSYVEWNCQGFNQIKVKGKVEFASTTFLPAKSDGTLKPDGSKLATYIEADVKDLNNLAFSFSIDPFQIKGVPDITFSCTDLAVDYSDYTNPGSIRFPKGYQLPFPAGSENLWRGVYIGKATIVLGPQFRKKNSKTPTTFGASNLVIDESGFTGTIFGTDILSLSEGDMNGWSFSIASLSISFLQNKLSAASFGGQMHIPLFKENSNLTYAANIDLEGKYNFVVSPTDSLSFSVFGDSKLVLYKNSTVDIMLDHGKFIPTANLTGNLSINASLSGGDSKKDNGKKGLKLANVEFQEMRISTVDPVFNVKYIAVSGLSQGALASFPITIDKIARL